MACVYVRMCMQKWLQYYIGVGRPCYVWMTPIIKRKIEGGISLPIQQTCFHKNFDGLRPASWTCGWYDTLSGGFRKGKGGATGSRAQTQSCTFSRICHGLKFIKVQRQLLLWILGIVTVVFYIIFCISSTSTSTVSTRSTAKRYMVGGLVIVTYDLADLREALT